MNDNDELTYDEITAEIKKRMPKVPNTKVRMIGHTYIPHPTDMTFKVQMGFYQNETATMIYLTVKEIETTKIKEPILPQTTEEATKTNDWFPLKLIHDKVQRTIQGTPTQIKQIVEGITAPLEQEFNAKINWGVILTP